MEGISEGLCSNIFAELKVLNASKGFNCTTNELLTFHFLKDPVEIWPAKNIDLYISVLTIDNLASFIYFLDLLFLPQ